MRKKHPILDIIKMHQGTDFVAPMGTPIMASGTGVVLKAGYAEVVATVLKLDIIVLTAQ